MSASNKDIVRRWLDRLGTNEPDTVADQHNGQNTSQWVQLCRLANGAVVETWVSGSVHDVDWGQSSRLGHDARLSWRETSSDSVNSFVPMFRLENFRLVETWFAGWAIGVDWTT